MKVMCRYSNTTIIDSSFHIIHHTYVHFHHSYHSYPSYPSYHSYHSYHQFIINSFHFTIQSFIFVFPQQQKTASNKKKKKIRL